MCHNAAATSSVIGALEFYRLGTYKSRDRFDLHKNVVKIRGEKFIHKIDIEDYWANLMYEQVVRKRIWSRMSMDFIRNCELFSIPNQVADDSDHTHLQYEIEVSKPILLPSWTWPEVVDLNELMREVNYFSREWVDKYVNKLIEMGVTLTYKK